MDSVTAAKIADLFDHVKGEALALLHEQEMMRAEASQVESAQQSDDEGITVAEAAQLIGVKEWRVYEMIRRGVLPAYRPSIRTLRIRRGTVKEFICTGRCTTVEKKGGAKLTPLRRVR